MNARPRRTLAAQVGIDEIHENTSTQIIQITSDKLKIILIEHVHKVDKSKAWHTPLSLLLAIVLVFCTADFKDAFRVSSSGWSAFFALSALASFAWLIISLCKIKSAISVEDLINAIKNKN